ncbi:hypothetical protein [Burkholderia plantarii]|uniref:hypothetical protein n=1 Tax=Burkholderia plantarii TaxID=41899 RepID=UPI001495C65D
MQNNAPSGHLQRIDTARKPDVVNLPIARRNRCLHRRMEVTHQAARLPGDDRRGFPVRAELRLSDFRTFQKPDSPVIERQGKIADAFPAVELDRGNRHPDVIQRFLLQLGGTRCGLAEPVGHEDLAMRKIGLHDPVANRVHSVGMDRLPGAALRPLAISS